METKKMKFKATSKKAKGGFNNTRTVLTSAGISAISAAAGAAISAAVQHYHDSANEDLLIQTDTAESPLEQQTPPYTTQEPQTPEEETTTLPPSQDQFAETTEENEARELLGKDEIDENDVDAEGMFTVVDSVLVPGPFGEDIVVVQIRTEDGTDYLLADIDGDGVFNNVFDMDGNLVGEAEGNLTAGDLAIMADDSGNYIAAVEDIPGGEDPINGIIVTDNENLLAENENVEEPEVGLPGYIPVDTGEQVLADNELIIPMSEEEILAELTTDYPDDVHSDYSSRIYEIEEDQPQDEAIEDYVGEDLVDNNSMDDFNDFDDL